MQKSYHTLKHIAACAGAAAKAARELAKRSSTSSSLKPDLEKWDGLGHGKSSFKKLEKHLNFHKIHISRVLPDADYDQITQVCKISGKKWKKPTFQR